MKTPNKIVIANLRQNKKRTMATLIAIILSCTLLFAVGIAYSSYLQDDINDTAKRVGSYHVLYYDMDYKDTLSYLENTNKTEDIYVMQQVSKFKKDYKDYQVLSYTELNPEIQISYGREPQNDKEILVSSNVFYGLNLALGATFEGYSVVGVYDNRYILEEYPYANGLLKPNYISTLLTKKELDKDNEHSCFFVTYKNIKKAYETMEIDAKNLGFELIDMNIQINKEFLEANGVGISSNKYAMKLLFLALGLYVISIFCMLIIYNAFAISLAERKKQFGTLRSIGTSKKTIIGMITKELLILSLIALPISFLLGLSIVFVALKVLDVLLNITIPITINLLIILITIFFIFFSMVISAYTPGRKASKTSPMEAIRSTRDFKIKKSNRNYNLTKKIFGAEGQLARKNLKRNGKQFGTVVTSLTISMILFILVSTIVNFMTLEIRSFEVDNSAEYSDINIQIHYNDKKDAENILSKIEKMNYIDSMDVYKSSARAIVPEENSKYTDIAANSFTNYIIVIGMSKDELEQFAVNNNLSIGKKYFINITNINKEDFDNKNSYQIFTNTDSITLCKYTNSGVVCDKEMNDVELIDHHLVIDDYNSEETNPALIMESEELETFIKENPGYVKDDKYFNVGIKSEKFKELDKEVLKIIDSYKDLSISYMNQPLDLYNQKRQILYIQIIVYAGIGFIGLISLVGLLNSINNNLNLREKEFAMLRSMGYSKKSLNKMITLENVFLISRSFIQALILTLIGFLALNYFIFYTNIDELSSAPIIYIPFPWVYTIIAFIAVILIILFLTSFSIKKIKNQNIIEAIRKDSI